MCLTIGKAPQRWTMHAGWCAIGLPAFSMGQRPWSNEC